METIINLVGGNPLYTIIGVILFILIVFSIVKKIFKMAMIVLAIIIAYSAFIFVTEDDPVKQIKKKVETGKAAVEKIDDATQDIRDDAVEKLVDEVEEKLKEAVKKK